MPCPLIGHIQESDFALLDLHRQVVDQPLFAGVGELKRLHVQTELTEPLVNWVAHSSRIHEDPGMIPTSDGLDR